MTFIDFSEFIHQMSQINYTCRLSNIHLPSTQTKDRLGCLHLGYAEQANH